MNKEVVWHPEVYRRFMGPMRFFFVSSYFFRNFHERVDTLIEEWGLSKFSRDVLIGAADILLRAHCEEKRQEMPLQIYLNDAMGGVGAIRTFFAEPTRTANPSSNSIVVVFKPPLPISFPRLFESLMMAAHALAIFP